MYIAMIDFPVLERDRATVLSALARDAAEARAMPGNLGFRVLGDTERPEEVAILHRWRDKADFEAYLASPTFARIGAEIRPLMAGAPVSLRMHAQEDETLNG
ncbi:MAG: putative quinol monooxygenase [Pseudooceanicola sp.]